MLDSLSADAVARTRNSKIVVYGSLSMYFFGNMLRAFIIMLYFVFMNKIPETSNYFLVSTRQSVFIKGIRDGLKNNLVLLKKDLCKLLQHHVLKICRIPNIDKLNTDAANLVRLLSVCAGDNAEQDNFLELARELTAFRTLLGRISHDITIKNEVAFYFQLNNIVCEEVTHHLKDISEHIGATGYNDVVLQLQESGVQSIWGSIKNKVSQRMLLLTSTSDGGTSNPACSHSIDAGRFVDIVSGLNLACEHNSEGADAVFSARGLSFFSHHSPEEVSSNLRLEASHLLN